MTYAFSNHYKSPPPQKKEVKNEEKKKSCPESKCSSKWALKISLIRFIRRKKMENYCDASVELKKEEVWVKIANTKNDAK